MFADIIVDMNRSELDDLKQIAAKKRDQAITAAHAEYEELLRSIDRVWSLATAESHAVTAIAPATNQSSPVVFSHIPPRRGRPPKKNSPIALARESIARLPNGVTVHDVFDQVLRSHGEQATMKAISSAINKMLQRREVVKVEGKDGRLSKYYKAPLTEEILSTNERTAS